MLETYEVLELERRWRAYDKKRREFKFSDKKNYIYAISAVLAISVSVSSLTFYLLKDSLLNNNISSTTISNDIKESNKNDIKHSENIEPEQKIDPSNNTLLNSDNFGGTENISNTQNNSIANEDTLDNANTEIQQHGWVNLTDMPQDSQPVNMHKNIGGKQVAVKIPTEEIINFDSEKPMVAKNMGSLQNLNKFQIQSSDSEISVDELTAKFDKSNSSDIAVLIARRYYDIKDYKNSEKWALIANELDSNNEESWIIFAKSKYNLKQKDDAISVLKIYNDKANSSSVEDLMRQIEDDTVL
ncbi:transformation system protein [Campylobacter rectus]|uniref:transformation system protein n=1 Tax=Campylobacter rectus TaxID=203 RepID=UPI0028E6E821|nr:transformation system protein [Campylobacter rectus]